MKRIFDFFKGVLRMSVREYDNWDSAKHDYKKEAREKEFYKDSRDDRDKSFDYKKKPLPKEEDRDNADYFYK